MNQDDIKKYIVCINGGSGVIFQPMDIDYSYILTAKHIFEDIASDTYNNLVSIYFFNAIANAYELITPLFELEKGENYFPHSEDGVDIVIIKLPKIDNVEKIIIKEDISIDYKDYCLYGYPSIRRNPINQSINSGWFRADLDVTILTEIENKRREADISKNQNHAELIGSSGGGIVRIQGDYLVLAGIQSRVISNEEVLGRIEFTPIGYFNDIIDEYQDKLTPLLPPYMNNFKFLKDEILNLEGYFGETNVETIRNKLKLKVDEIQLKPNDILNLSFKDQLLVNNENKATILSKKLWTSWLEYLIVLQIVKNKVIDKNDVSEIFNKIRLIHSETQKDWMKIMPDIFKTDLYGLNDKGILIISTNKNPSCNIIEGKEIITNIANAFSIESFKTDNAEIHPLQQFKFMHINIFEKELEKNQIALNTCTGINVNQLIPKLKEIFDEIL
ncbi:ABC-three component system protein [Flavobacterium sp.]|uniref:ABC-three component system protein n=1 Tax=Flavobacterium sp. TaxID=239 RepID=UPI00286B6655|nr:ABC-three component system protein [Flavobacterium sp.]